MKKLIMVIVTIAMLITLTACGNSQNVKDVHAGKYPLVYNETVLDGTRDGKVAIGYLKNNNVKHIRIYNLDVEERILRNPETKPYIIITDNQDIIVYRQPYVTYTNDTFEGEVVDKQVAK